MKNKQKHTDEVDKLINLDRINNYQPSADFVNRVMADITSSEIIKPAGKFIKVAFTAVAAVALVFFVTNALIVFTNIGSSTENSEWSEVYTIQNQTNWYDYYNNELFIADNQTDE